MSILVVLASTMGHAQVGKQLPEAALKTKTEMPSAGANTNPYFVSNDLAGEMTAVSGGNSHPIEITKQRAKSNNTNERTTSLHNQDDESPFLPKSSVSSDLKTKHDTAKNSIGNSR